MRVRSRQFGEPKFKQFKDEFGNSDTYANAANRKSLSAGAFGKTELAEVGGKTYVVKTPKTPPKEDRRAMATGLSPAARRNLYRAQGRVTQSEVANTRVAAALGVAPKVVAANRRHIVSELARGSTVKKLNDSQQKELLKNLARLHRAGIAHNDLKPDNFFIDNSTNKMQFIDFGLSERSPAGVTREWYRAMNPASLNPLLGATGTATGAFYLRRFNETGYKRAESALRRVLKTKVSEDAIIAASRNPRTARQLQLVVNNFYEGKYNRANSLTTTEVQALRRQRSRGTGSYGTLPRRRTGTSYRRADDVDYRGEQFAGYNQPKRTPSHPSKSHAVLAKQGTKIRLIRFGQQGVKGSPVKKGESKSYAARRRAWKARHAANIAKGKMSAAYWANRAKW